MARLRRIKFSDANQGYYHIISRTIQKSFVMQEKEKEYFLRLLKKMCRVYFVKVSSFSILTNHFHLIVQMINPEDISLDELKDRFAIYYNEGVRKHNQRVFLEEDAMSYYRRWADVSCFVQDLKQRFSRWYNRVHNGCGTVWAERFKSVLLEGNKALLACMIYIELNSVRAGLVEAPEDYRYCGLAHMLAGGRAGQWLNRDILHSVVLGALPFEEDTSHRDIVQGYITMVYREGLMGPQGGLSGEQVPEPSRTEFGCISYLHRIRHFTEGVFLGSQTFCDEKFLEFRRYFQTKRIRQGILIYRHRALDEESPAATLQYLHSIRTYRY